MLNSQEGSEVKLPLNNMYMVLVTGFATIGGLLFGYDQGVVSFLASECENFAYHFPRIYTDADFKGWWVSSFLLSAWAGSLINSFIADKFSRKRSIIAASAIFVVGCVFQTVAMGAAGGLVMMFAGRVISGLAVGMLTMVVPMYIAETAPAKSRGSMVVVQQLSVTFGILVSYWIDYGTHFIGGDRCDPNTPLSGGTADEPKFDPYKDAPNGCTGQSSASWRIPLALQMAPALVLFGAMFVLPYSPRWLIAQGKEDEARRVLKRLRGATSVEQVEEEAVEIKAEILFERSRVPAHLQHLSGVRLYFGQMYHILRQWSSFKRVFIGSAVMFFQQFLGANAIIYYAPTIFQQIGLSGSSASLLASGVYSVVNFVSTIPAVLFVDRVGRRPLLMAGAVGSMISMIVVGSIIARYGADLVQHKTAGWAAVAFIYIYDINFSYSWAPIGWLLPSEIYNIGIRSKAISITTSSTWMCNFAIGLATPSMIENMKSGTYFFFAAFCLIGFLFTLFVIPETKGRTLEEMDAVFGDSDTTQNKRTIAEIANADGIDEDGLRKVSAEHVEEV